MTNRFMSDYRNRCWNMDVDMYYKWKDLLEKTSFERTKIACEERMENIRARYPNVKNW